MRIGGCSIACSRAALEFAGEHHVGKRADHRHRLAHGSSLDQRVEVVLRPQAFLHPAIRRHQARADDPPAEGVIPRSIRSWVYRAICARWNPPNPRWTIPPVTRAGSKRGTTTGGARRPRLVRLSRTGRMVFFSPERVAPKRVAPECVAIAILVRECRATPAGQSTRYADRPMGSSHGIANGSR